MRGRMKFSRDHHRDIKGKIMKIDSEKHTIAIDVPDVDDERISCYSAVYHPNIKDIIEWKRATNESSKEMRKQN